MSSRRPREAGQLRALALPRPDGPEPSIRGARPGGRTSWPWEPLRCHTYPGGRARCHSSALPTAHLQALPPGNTPSSRATPVSPPHCCGTAQPPGSRARPNPSTQVGALAASLPSARPQRLRPKLGPHAAAATSRSGHRPSLLASSLEVGCAHPSAQLRGGAPVPTRPDRTGPPSPQPTAPGVCMARPSVPPGAPASSSDLRSPRVPPSPPGQTAAPGGGRAVPAPPASPPHLGICPPTPPPRQRSDAGNPPVGSGVGPAGGSASVPAHQTRE